MIVLLIVLQLLHSATASTHSITDTVHKTIAAMNPPEDLFCYTCHSMEDGQSCVDNITANYSSYMRKCYGDDKLCMVKRFSYTTSTENATSGAKIWALERRCAKNCQSGCIVIGERTKLYECTSCCNSSYCNSGRGSGASGQPNGRDQTTGVLLVVLAGLVVMWTICAGNACCGDADDGNRVLAAAEQQLRIGGGVAGQRGS